MVFSCCSTPSRWLSTKAVNLFTCFMAVTLARFQTSRTSFFGSFKFTTRRQRSVASVTILFRWQKCNKKLQNNSKPLCFDLIWFTLVKVFGLSLQQTAMMINQPKHFQTFGEFDLFNRSLNNPQVDSAIIRLKYLISLFCNGQRLQMKLRNK